MSEIKVIFESYDSNISKNKTVPLDLCLDDALQGAVMSLGLQNASYRFGLVRTGEVLATHLTFEESKILPNDRLVLIPFDKTVDWTKNNSKSYEYVDLSATDKNASDGIPYKLSLSTIGNNKKLKDHIIYLDEYYENHPNDFFSDFNNHEKTRFENFYRNFIENEDTSYSINKILKIWCDDISQGYRLTLIEI